jgi:DDE domain
MDEVVVSIAGRKCWLWRAVDQEGFYRVSERVTLRGFSNQHMTDSTW